jgi:outer membrane protein assembly factor BamA
MRFTGMLISLMVATTLIAADSAETKSENWGIVPVALPYYTPDTSIAFGTYTVLWFQSGESRASDLSVYGTYSIKNQLALGLLPEVYFLDERLKLSGQFEYNRYPQGFWGLGPHTASAAEETYTPTGIFWFLATKLKIAEGLYAGPYFRFRSTETVEADDGGLIDSRSVPGSDGTRVVGLGASAEYDSRDNTFFPRAGGIGKVTVYHAPESLGSEYAFGRCEIDLRRYWGISGDHVVAFQALGVLGWGDMPFQEMRGLGGNEMMRGLYTGRYLDRNSLAMQLEYRFPLYWRFAGVLFASEGAVARNADGFELSSFHPAFGGGLRILLDTEKHIAIRIDVGFDEYGSGKLYFLVKEAF